MPYKRKQKGSKSKFWWASFTDAYGKRIRVSTGTTQKREAVALESKWKAEAFRGKAWGDRPSRSLGDLMLDYLTATKAKLPQIVMPILRSDCLGSSVKSRIWRLFDHRTSQGIGSID